MKVTVFGGAGFLGSHVADALTEKGYDVVVYDVVRSPYIKGSQKMVVGDILDGSNVQEAVSGSDYVYNFAGVADITEAEEDPLKSVKANVLGNTLILEACRKNRVRRFVFASSLYVYGRAGSFYRSTKQACELLIENYKEVYDLPYTILRYGSLYGDRADDSNFVHRVLRQALEKGAIVRHGDGEEIREYIHVQDAAKSSVDILSDGFENQNIIITGDQQMKVRDLLEMVREMLGNNIEIRYTDPELNSHYETTPYAFTPRLARRIIKDTYIDLGQGILKCLQDLYDGTGGAGGSRAGGLRADIEEEAPVRGPGGRTV